MKTYQFLELLEKNPEKELVFEYAENRFVPNAYHITEVKNIHIDAVDCGGRPSEDFQTVIQLWVSPDEVAEKNMSAGKALKIFKLVDGIKPMNRDAEVLLEWGNEFLPTSNYRMKTIEIEPKKILVKLFVPPTACKPRLELAEQVAAICCS